MWPARLTIDEIEDQLATLPPTPQVSRIRAVVSRQAFTAKAPTHNTLPAEPRLHELETAVHPGPEPKPGDFSTNLQPIDRILFWRKRKIEEADQKRYLWHREEYLNERSKYDKTTNNNAQIQDEFRNARKIWNAGREAFERAFSVAKDSYAESRERFLQAQRREIDVLDNIKYGYESEARSDIERYFDFSLRNSSLNELFDLKPKAVWDSEVGILLVEFDIPNFEDDIELLKTSQSRRKPYKAGERERRKFQEVTAYSIALRTCHDVVVADFKNLLQLIVVNGNISFVDKSNGQRRSEYILSLQVTPAEMREVKIEAADPKECFRMLKGLMSPGVAAGKPAAIRPIMEFDFDDARIVQGRDVVDGIDPSTNLASIDWQDFEHLIRELFEKHFATSGARVEVTRASRDQGVDAIIFDPDPIRGGKFVIQAKRYTNTLDVSAVRDLYGTVVNEGANKGILVTTSNFGPDSYQWSKDKAITLINGRELLGLLKDHGHDFRIDLAEARRILKEEK